MKRVEALKKVRKNKKWLGLILYAVFLAVGLLYYLFPSDAFRNHLQTIALRKVPDVLVSIGKISPSFPFGLNLTEFRISPRAVPAITLFEADRIMIRPGLWSFFQGKLRYNFDCFAYSGSLSGWFRFTEDTLSVPFSTSMRLKDIRIHDCAPILAWAGRNIEGVVGGEITYSGQYNALAEGSMEARIGFSDGRVELLRPVLCFDAIEFNDLTLKMSLENRKVDISDVRLISQDIQGSLSGIIELKKQVSKSSLELKGVIEPLGNLSKGNEGNVNCRKLLEGLMQKGKLPFLIQGTLTRPSFKFI